LVAGSAAVLYIGATGVRSGSITLGDLLLVMFYIASINGPLETITRTLADVQSSLASAERVFSVLDEPPDVAEDPEAVPVRCATGTVAFEDVSFSYVAREVVLDRVSFQVPPGAYVGIAGATGAGKTTLVSLLVRLYDPVGGRILLDGRDIRDY